MTRVRIDSAASDTFPIVRFSGDSGEGEALWRSDSAPILGTDVDVEFELPDEFLWERNVGLADEDTPTGFRLTSGGPELVGYIVDFDADGSLAVRVSDALVVVTTVGDPPLALIGHKVILRPRSIELYQIEF